MFTGVDEEDPSVFAPRPPRNSSHVNEMLNIKRGEGIERGGRWGVKREGGVSL